MQEELYRFPVIPKATLPTADPRTPTFDFSSTVSSHTAQHLIPWRFGATWAPPQPPQAAVAGPPADGCAAAAPAATAAPPTAAAAAAPQAASPPAELPAEDGADADVSDECTSTVGAAVGRRLGTSRGAVAVQEALRSPPVIGGLATAVPSAAVPHSRAELGAAPGDFAIHVL